YPAELALRQSRLLGGDGLRSAYGLLAKADVDLRGATALPEDAVLEVAAARPRRGGEGVSASPYLPDNRRDEAADRFSALAALYDPMTAGHFDTIGVAAGWRCLEIGAGGGSVVRHL